LKAAELATADHADIADGLAPLPAAAPDAPLPPEHMEDGEEAAQPQQQVSPRQRIATLLAHAIAYLPYLWLVGAPLTFLLLTPGLVGTERRRRHSTPITAGPVYDACHRLRASLQVSRQVGLARCER